LNEVYNGDGIRAEDYLGVGDIFDFNSAYELKSILEYPGGAGKLNAKKQTLVALPPSDQVITMVTNHDTERGGTALTYNDGKAFVLANQALLTRTYGTPMLFSGYAFSDRDAAPVGVDGKVLASSCAKAKTAVQSSYNDGKFFCTQRWKAIRGMISWRNFVGAEPETNGYGKKAVYAVGRGKLGFFAMNSGTKAYSSKLVSSMARGTYCDLVSAGTNPFKGSGAGRKCAGLTVKVDAKHRLIAKIAPMSSIAITAASKR
jgi:alpha-amylase